MRFAESLSKLDASPSQASQPSDGGNKAPASDNADEGDAGKGDSGDQGTTADAAADSTAKPEPQGADPKDKWSPEEEAQLKAHKWDTLPFSAEARALLKSNQSLRTEFDRVSGSNASAISEVEGIRTALYAGDAKKLQELTGVDLKLDQRTPDVMIDELQKEHGRIREVLHRHISKLEAKGRVEEAEMLFEAGNEILDAYNVRAKVLQDEKTWQDRESKLMKKVGKAEEPQDGYRRLSEKAQTNLAALTQEDPNAPKYLKTLEDATKAGGALRAINVDLARAFGTNLQTARFMLQVAKGLHIAKEMPSILASEKKKWEADHARKKAAGGTPGSAGKDGSAPSEDTTISHLRAGMRAYMGRR